MTELGHNSGGPGASRLLAGIGVSAGLVVAPVVVLKRQTRRSSWYHLPAEHIEREVDRFIRAVVDATRDLLVNVLPYKPFLIKPNNHELSEITGVRLTNDKEIAAAAHMMQDKGARNVLVSMAGDGALLLDEHGTVYRIGCPRGKVVNSVGAGDSMVAGFVAGYQQSGGDYEAALRLGTACGSATAFSLGLATKADIDALLATM